MIQDMNHGCDDAKISNPSDRYINQPKKGPPSILMNLWMDIITAIMPAPVTIVVQAGVIAIT